MFSRPIVVAFLRITFWEAVTPFSHSWKTASETGLSVPERCQDHLSWPVICVGCFLWGHSGAQVGRHGHDPVWVRQPVSLHRPFPKA